MKNKYFIHTTYTEDFNITFKFGVIGIKRVYDINVKNKFYKETILR